MAKTAKILIVEDSKTQMIQLQSLLESEKFIVNTAENGKEALAVLDETIPDVIISDIIMPEMDGYEFCKNLKAKREWNDIPVILLTSLTDPQDVIKGLNVGADNFIPKPFSKDFLLSRIDYLLINKKMRSGSASNMGMEIFFGGQRHLITSERMQIMDLLLSTYENAVNKNNELIETNHELTKVKEDLEKKNIQLEKTNEEKNRFIGMAAHDIRNPLGAIFNFADLLKDELGGSVNESQLELFDYIKISADSLLKLVNELLDVSKIEAGKLELRNTLEDVVKFVKKNIYKNKYLAEKKGIKITEIYETSSILAKFDLARMDQVINNLISNAIKYSNPDTSIIIKIEKEGSNVRFLVQDHGVGIREEEMDKLFKPFSKTSSTTTAGESSTGLGLFTCKKIIEAHSGEIGAHSEVGKGSTFYFTLPVLDTQENNQSNLNNTKVDDNVATLQGKRILVVDDNSINYSYFKAAFSGYSVELEYTAKGKESIEFCRNNMYDLILMDYHLPDLNGLDATRSIRTFNKDVVIVCQTANVIDGIEEKCLLAGCNGFMAMPIKPREVIEVVVKNLQ